MDVYLRRHGRRNRTAVKLGERVAGGGAGDIHLVTGYPDQVIKIYRVPADRRAYHPKIEAMLAAPPRTFSYKHLGQERHQLAWPTSLVETQNGEFLGFAMPQIDFDSSVSLERMLQKRMREISNLNEFYGYRISVAYNLAQSVAELHKQKHHIIDLKPVNCRIYTDGWRLALLDCDGFSIHSGKQRFPASQFTEEYISPEATGKSPDELGVEQDLFALAVTIFRLLNNGLHPFQAKLTSGENGGTLQEMIEAGHYPYALSGSSTCAPPRQSVHGAFPTEMRKAFDQAFLKTNRPTAAKWRDLLRQFADPSSGKLIRCEVDPKNHAHFGRGCGWCDMEVNLATPGASGQFRNQPIARARNNRGTPAPAANIVLSQLTPFRTKRMVLVTLLSMVLSLIIAQTVP
jgi:DNA-binding helix-hairpin-helix protein with protein kinase domain